MQAIRSSFGYIGTHTSLLLSGITFLLLQQYIWTLNIARQGYGPDYTTSYLETLSALVVIIDLIILTWAVRGSKRDKHLSLIYPAAFFGLTLITLIANNT